MDTPLMDAALMREAAMETAPVATDQVEVAVVGLGQTGLSVARYLYEQGVAFVVADTRLSPPGLTELQALCPDVPLWLGPLNGAQLGQMQQLIVSPGIAIAEPALQQAQQAGAEIIGDIELFARAHSALATPVPVIAITGSNAKSTVTTLVGEMARQAGWQVGVGGNIGTPALSLLGAPYDLIVLELSSFQLETTQSLHCQVATILNLSEDHLDRYDGMTGYIQAKQRIFLHAAQAVVPLDEPLTYPQAMAETVPLTTFGRVPEADFGLATVDGQRMLMQGDQPLCPVSAITLPGGHGQLNALAALALGHAVGLPMPAMLATLADFNGLAHRCEQVAVHQGVTWFNDSKATNVGATLAAIAGLAPEYSRLWVILGGEGKGQDFTPLSDPLLKADAVVMLLGRDAPLIEQALDKAIPLQSAADLPAAVAALAEQAQPGDAVLLSPACASFDMFQGFAHRGEVFAQCVQQLSP